MIIIVSIIVIAFVAIFLAVRAADHELSVPQEVARLKINKKKKEAGVILFLKEKIVHYTSSSS